MDNFKLINDKEGHPIGDQVLKKFANCLQSCFGKEELIARMGGDEFAVFTQTKLSREGISDKLEYLLQLIRIQLGDYHKRYGFSVSMGVAYVDDYTNSYDDLYRCADDALYVAKRHGKNRFYINS